MDAGLIAVAFRGAAKLALEKAGSSAGKEAVDIIFAELFGGGDQRFDELDRKLEVLKSGQKRLNDQVEALRVDLGLGATLRRINNKVHGLRVAMMDQAPSHHEVKDIQRFLDTLGPDSARELADDLAQKLFGTNQVTPDRFWNPRAKVDTTGTLGLGHVANIVSGQFQRNVAPLKSYVDDLMALHTELVSYFALLAGSIIAVHQYMLEKGNRVLGEAGKPLYVLKADRNPALFAPPGSAGMASDWILDYVVQSAPQAFDLYRSLFIERKERRIGLTTKARNRILEWETDGARKPIEVGHSALSHNYEGFKPVYADHEDKGRSSSRQWWRIRPAEPADPADDAILVKADEGEHYLGEYKYLIYSTNTKFGQHRTYSNEIGPGGSASDPLSRWRLYLRRENGEGETTFVLAHKSTKRCLLVNGLDSPKNRQIHLDQSVEDRGDWIDYAFKVVNPPA